MKIGAGTLVTVALALAIGGYGVYQQQRTAARPPVIERQVRGATASGIAPVPEFLLRHRRELALTAAQADAIGRIAAHYRRDIQPTERQLAVASRAFAAFISKPGKRPLAAPAISARSADVQRLSAALVMTRQAYWRQALATLRPAQQQQARTLTSAATLADLR
jgi:hypothetical protein